MEMASLVRKPRILPYTSSVPGTIPVPGTKRDSVLLVVYASHEVLVSWVNIVLEA